MGPIGSMYLDLHDQFDALARSLDPEHECLAVPATPGWTVHDLVAHVTGVADDAVNGRMAGAPGEAWTAAQVERGRSMTLTELLDRWVEQAPLMASVLDAISERRPPIDLLTHQHDLRGAIDRPGTRTGGHEGTLARRLVADLAPDFGLEVHTDSGALTAPGETRVVLRTSDFELLRSRLGRRSLGQVLAYDWTGDPAPLLEGWFIFGPAGGDLVE